MNDCIVRTHSIVSNSIRKADGIWVGRDFSARSATSSRRQPIHPPIWPDAFDAKKISTSSTCLYWSEAPALWKRWSVSKKLLSGDERSKRAEMRDIRDLIQGIGGCVGANRR
ncbi:MAG: hypothetical protein GY847_37675 [Proteobacteria bacterium]|nr:hypothetical protein [Pseudomonadota bacterium]